MYATKKPLSWQKLNINSWFSEAEVYKWITGIQASFIALCAGLGIRFSFNFLKRKNDDIQTLKKDVTFLKQEFSKISKVLVVKKEELIEGKIVVKEIAINEYVQEINHRLINRDLAEASSFDMILEKLDNINKK